MSKKLNRNDPCHCGSGKKYKQCCLKNESQAARYTSSGKFKFSAEVVKSTEQEGNACVALFQKSSQSLNPSSEEDRKKFSITKDKVRPQGKRAIRRQLARADREVTQKLQKHQFSLVDLSDNVDLSANNFEEIPVTDVDYRVEEQGGES